MKGQDIVLLLKLISFEQSTFANGDTNPGITVRGLERYTGISKSEVNSALHRCVRSGLATPTSRKRNLSVNRQALLDFIHYGLPYVFPVAPAELTRGIPTAFAAPVLNKKIFSAGKIIPVWPDPTASEMGEAIKPLYHSVTLAVKEDDRLYAYLALVDAIRLGNAREKNTATVELRKAIAPR